MIYIISNECLKFYWLTKYNINAFNEITFILLMGIYIYKLSQMLDIKCF